MKDCFSTIHTQTHKHTHTHIHTHTHTHIYIYICMEVVSLLLYLRDRQMTYLLGAALLCDSVFQRVCGFAGEALDVGEMSFLILLSSEWTSGIFSHLTLKTFIFIVNPRQQTFPIGLPITDHFVFYYFLTCQPVRCADIRMWEEYSFNIPDFNWLSNQTTI